MRRWVIAVSVSYEIDGHAPRTALARHGQRIGTLEQELSGEARLHLWREWLISHKFHSTLFSSRTACSHVVQTSARVCVCSMCDTSMIYALQCVVSAYIV